MSKLQRLIEKHEKLRGNGAVNLIASENSLPVAAREALASDLQGRYHSAWYGGTRYVREVMTVTEELACEVFDATHAVVSSLSGNLCDLAALLAFTKPGDGVGILPFTAGGYPLDMDLFDRKRVDLPVKESTFETDTEALGNLESMELLIAGASYIPFPHPLKPLLEFCRPLVYDGSHVLGLIGSGVFQDPLGEGADALIGSTHKSLYGPQGGLVVTRSAETDSKFRAVLDFNVEAGIGLVDNPHPSRIVALGLALEHLLQDRDYGGRVVANAQALGAALAAEGVPVRFAERGFTESHQVFLDLDESRAKILCESLERAGVFIDIAGRMGTAEVTTRGMEPGDMKGVASTMAKVFREMEG
ncbi:MAG: PLP-dependent aminotransferase family protein [Planctomycetota bacterium]|jgi:glycine hydroxymethyltransferase